MSITTMTDVKLPVTEPETELLKIAEKRLKRKPTYFSIKKKSLDARDKENLRYVYTIEFSSNSYQPEKPSYEQLIKSKTPQKPVVIIGSGPAGLFCAIRLLEHGIKPIVIERGERVEERAKAIDKFISKKTLDENSNVQFGEGGAGTFSDGKLNTQTHTPLNKAVLETFVKFGAPKEILWLNKPHLGSDNLKQIVKNMREHILNQGGEILFSTKMTDIKIKDGAVASITLQTLKTAEQRQIQPELVVLAIGHSARDTFEMLRERGVCMRQKDFAVGVRIEHLQEKISFSQYGKNYKLLPPADYKLVSKTGDRSAFTFCMCPGGFVMPAASEYGGVVVNGMSNYARNEKNANSALIVQVRSSDFESDDALAGMEYQRKLERAAFIAGGGDYSAPIQKVGDFLDGKASDCFGEVLPSHGAGTKFFDLKSVLPNYICDSLKIALLDMDRRLKGFCSPDALLTAVETRTSSPIRIERTESMQSINVNGLYPCGEGAGYAGGITSSAADGLRVAEAIFSKLNQ
ncbi:MAG: FAD-dependent oxidoreductase [Clostridia bacterium]|nr:FAD-dependent oxidoreductase [Clostridia bacterium]